MKTLETVRRTMGVTRDCINSFIRFRWDGVLTEPHRNSLLRQIFLHFTNAEFPKMKNARSENGISFAIEKNFRHMLQSSRAATGYDRHANGFTDAPRDNK